MKVSNLEIGSKVKLSINGKVREYKITLIENGSCKLFNKFQVSFFATLEFINENLVD